ncbi:hypothetical protein Palpr_2046 [Paludibacter propionicigenes WB4]|uniref:Uncharacterized protein n=1 Tax=Paludibacter propionicigenes (strain DSM 17365 / JCM 13257 / WB4) TaxID=694427 RepID=E4T639_PALPW|nr:hypothetical protein [Paludibacter propionicigenes]ADQ80183.1 hypothetical protein Palpr_2046 [Paludibacter propionicigenes WB4]
MSKVFRLYNIQGNPNIVDWQDANVYGVQAISEITDPDGADAKKEITSIPSPFARIDLIKTAFREVVNMANRDSRGRGYAGLDGKTIYHKMVSDAFDIAQIFFNIETFKDKFEILVWDRSKDLKVNNVLGKTLKRYLESDATGDDPYNFGKLERIYLLNYIGPDRPGNLNIVGATSPATLFFSSANDLSYVSKNINFGQDRPFDHEYQPLYKRDFEFQKYIYAFREAYGIKAFGKHFREIEDYLISSTGKECNYKHLNEEQKRIIDDLDESSIAGYEPITVGEKGADQLDILGKPFHKKTKLINWQSDFEIESTLFQGEKKPLVLPVEAGNTYENLKFTTDKWGKQHKAPYYNNTLWTNRKLPIVDDEYPYLTISDFLTDTIVRMPYEINKESFFDGNIDRADGKSYLLPLTDLFFQFFTTDQLRGTLRDGKKMFELKNNAGGVTAVLRIPIKGNKHIEYRRTYFEAVEPDIENNDGGLVEEDFVYAQFPLIKFKTNNEAYYRMGLLSNFDNAEKYSLRLYYQNNSLKSDFIVRNEQDNRYNKYKTYILEKSNFDYLRIDCNNEISGIVLPEFKHQGGMQQYTFAIDFGTTNMHIEYSLDNNPAKPFDITKDEMQIHLLLKVVDIMRRNIFNYDMLPPTLGMEEEFKLPMRTVLSEALTTDWNSSVFPMAQVNIPFPYERKTEPEYNKIITNLKWSNEKDNIKRVTNYIESLFLILRNKVILNNGDISKTKIIWFYPISMTQHRYDLFKKAWEETYKKYFGTNVQNVISITESVAPYEFYKSSAGNTSNMVSIDIGGGTSDIVIAKNKEVKFISSFRFAANSVFGDGYVTSRNGSIQNGIIRQFKEEIDKILKNNNMDDLVKIYTRLDHKNVSSDLASFFFSLKNNKEVVDASISNDLDFNRILQADDKQKIVFLFFYVAIIYHLVHLMKAKDIPMPRHITFSGNGSKMIQILTTNTRLLENFTKMIFEKIYNEKYPSDGLTIIQSPTIPKEATCKGGISSQIAQDYTQISATKVVLKGSDNCTFISNETYGNIDQQQYIARTTEEIRKFIQFTFDLNNDFSFKNNFGIDSASFSSAKTECFRDLAIYTENGLKQKLSEVSDDDLIEETFFFYPLNGMLYALSSKICELNSENTAQ